MRIVIEHSKFVYRKDSYFRHLLTLTKAGKNEIYFQNYPGNTTDKRDGRLFLNKKEVIVEDIRGHQLAKASLVDDKVTIKIEAEKYAFYKGKEKASLYKESEQVASIWLNYPHFEQIDITINPNESNGILALIILGIIQFKTGWAFPETLLDKLMISDKVEESKEWRAQKLTQESRAIEFKEELDKVLAIQHPRELIFDDRFLLFPWLQDTLQYWGERPIALKETLMSHLLRLLAKVEDGYDYSNCAGYAYARSSYKAGLYIYSPDGDWDYEVIGKALQNATSSQTIIDLIDILEDSCDKRLYKKYIQAFEDHDSMDVRSVAEEAKQRMV